MTLKTKINKIYIKKLKTRIKIYKRNKISEKTNINEKFDLNKQGTIFTGLTGILLISFLLLTILFINLAINQNNNNQEAIATDQYNYIIEDYKENIPEIARDTIEEISKEVIIKKEKVENAREEVKKRLNEKLAIQNQKYYNDYNILINSSIISIENSSNPFSVHIETYISSVKNNISYKNTVENEVSIEGLKDPVGVIICGKDNSFSYNETKVNYGHSLANYLKNKNVGNYSYYENATAPFIIKKCPFDPYIHHGDGNTMKNCRDNGYYHESADGACYLCRLEGKAGCPHYGFETFIMPNKTNETNLTSACSADHVIYDNENTYPGLEVIYYSQNGLNEILFLDPHGHKMKYGMYNKN